MIESTIFELAQLLTTPIQTLFVTNISKIAMPLQESQNLVQAHANKSITSLQASPVEIQLKIWEYALPGPRIITTRHEKIRGRRVDHNRLVRTLYVVALQTIPAMLHTYSISRLVALKHYRMMYLNGCEDKAIYVDFDIDTLYFATHQAFGLFTRQIGGGPSQNSESLQMNTTIVDDMTKDVKFLAFGEYRRTRSTPAPWVASESLLAKFWRLKMLCFIESSEDIHPDWEFYFQQRCVSIIMG